MGILKTKTNKDNTRTNKVLNNLKIFKNLNLSIEGELLANFKSKTASKKTTMTKVIIKAIEDYLNA